jgi:L-alanine-DL-glutamate epimerase-like enolase superfamily enzyme
LLRGAASGVAIVSSLKALPEIQAAVPQASPPVNKNSAPSDLKITDMRAVSIATNYDYPIIRIDTNQGVYGYGDVFAGSFKGSALMLKAHLLGRNPLDISGILSRIRLSAGHGFWNTGYGAIDIALHDIAGKVYGVPAYRLLGQKQRDRIRIYCDTAGSKDPKIYGQRMLERKKKGFTFFKMDLYTSMVADRPGAVDHDGVATEKGLGYMCEYIAAVRDAVGQDAPIAADHFGRLTVNDAIRYGKAFEPYHLAWAEDFIGQPWRRWREYKQITDNTNTVVLTGEQSFGLEEGYVELLDNHAVDLIHPDIVASGGMREIKRISDYAAVQGIPTVIHQPGSPVGAMAAAHLAATLPNFVCCENHAVDMPWWDDLVTKPASKPIIKDGYITVPETPGLGVELNEEVVRKHLRVPGYFEPTPMYNEYICAPLLSRGPWPHYDDNGVWCDNCTSY